MKRIKVRPGKFVLVSDELAEKAARAAAAIWFTREDVERIAAAEPRGATIFAGPLKPNRRRYASRNPKLSQQDSSAHSRIALKVRQMLGERTVNAEPFDVDAWVIRWMKQPLTQLGGKNPVEAIDEPGGWDAVEAVLEGMHGGLPG
jgi:hypothetical protein